MNKTVIDHIRGVIIISVLFMLALATMHTFSLDFLRKSQAKDLVRSARNDLLMGDRSRAFHLLASKIGPNQSFGAIELFEANTQRNILIGDRFGEKFQQNGIGNILLYQKFVIPINFDEADEGSFGKFYFHYYRFENLYLILCVWTILVICISTFAVRNYFTAQRSMEQRLLDRKHQTMAEMTRMISHDLRSPLSIFEHMIYLPPDTPIRDEIPHIRYALNRINGLIDSFRNMDIETIIQCSPALLNFEVAIAGLKSRAQRRSIQIRYPTQTSIFVNVDHLKFERAWVNMLSNAIDFAKSKVIIEVDVTGMELLLRVIDDGPGVPEVFLPKLFERGSTHGKHDGTGLGLAYVRQIMRGHGGDVRYYREHGMTIFESFLPNAVVKLDDPREHQATEKSGFPPEMKGDQPVINQVSICFKSDFLNQRVHERLSKIPSATHAFTIGFHQNSSIILTNFEEMAEQAMAADQRIIMFDEALSDDEIVRRAPIRLGLRG